MNNREIKYSGVYIRVFKLCQAPHRSPDKITQGGSKYWFGQNRKGKFMIRKSNHWNKVGESYYVFNKHIPTKCEVGQVRTGKTYLTIS